MSERPFSCPTDACPETMVAQLRNLQAKLDKFQKVSNLNGDVQLTSMIDQLNELSDLLKGITQLARPTPRAIDDLVVGDDTGAGAAIRSYNYSPPAGDAGGEGWKLNPDGSIEAYGDAHAFEGMIISNNGDTLVIIGGQLADVSIRYPRPSQITKASESRIYTWVPAGDFITLPLSSYVWTNSATTPGEYYVTTTGGGPLPVDYIPTSFNAMEPGTLGSLGVGEWAWGNQDGLGFDTIYVNATISGETAVGENGWLPNTPYSVGDVIRPLLAFGPLYDIWVCVQAGTSGSSMPSFSFTPTTDTTDGGVVWRWLPDGNVNPQETSYWSLVNQFGPRVFAGGSSISYGIDRGLGTMGGLYYDTYAGSVFSTYGPGKEAVYAIGETGVRGRSYYNGLSGKFGEDSHHAKFEADGTLVFVGNATVWDDVLPSSVTVGGGASAPSFTAYNGNLRAYEFLGTGPTSKEIVLAFQLPHDYKEGSTITPHIHLYIPDDGTGGIVRFTCEYTWISVGDAEPSTATATGTTTVAASAGNQGNVILSFGTIAGTGKTISSIFSCVIARDPADAGDTFGSSVWLKSADIHCEKDTVGSRQILTK